MSTYFCACEGIIRTRYCVMQCIDIKYHGIGFCHNDARLACVWIGQSIFGGFTTIMLSHQFARDCIACLTGRELMTAGVRSEDIIICTEGLIETLGQRFSHARTRYLTPLATSAMIRLTFLLINSLC
jgi:hypothetical protein